MINHYESIPYALKPTDSTGRFPWFLNHQNGWCDPRLGSDAAIRSWLCLGHPVVKPPVGPPLVIGVGWKWNKGKNIALKSCSMGIYQETWKSSMAICWFTWGLLLEEIRLLRVPAVFFAWKYVWKMRRFSHGNLHGYTWIFVASTLLLYSELFHELIPKNLSSETWMKPASNYGPFGW